MCTGKSWEPHRAEPPSHQDAGALGARLGAQKYFTCALLTHLPSIQPFPQVVQLITSPQQCPCLQERAGEGQGLETKINRSSLSKCFSVGDVGVSVKKETKTVFFSLSARRSCCSGSSHCGNQLPNGMFAAGPWSKIQQIPLKQTSSGVFAVFFVVTVVLGVCACGQKHIPGLQEVWE